MIESQPERATKHQVVLILIATRDKVLVLRSASPDTRRDVNQLKATSNGDLFGELISQFTANIKTDRPLLVPLINRSRFGFPLGLACAFCRPK